MKKIHLIMPMGGAGSRFFKNGFVMPKPLIEIQKKPFLYWATKSISKYVEVEDITFVVLKQHIEEFEIDKTINEKFPNAKIVVIPQILNGAVLTCMEGVKNIEDDLPIVFNDCDHAFISSEFNTYCKKAEFNKLDGGLLTFESDDPKYSYLQMNEDGNVIHTVEKQVVSTHAICGAYYFKNKNVFLECAKEYLDKCSYSEYFVSGVYNIMAEKDMKIANFKCDIHVPFGTPDEYYKAENNDIFRKIEEN